MKVIYDGTCPVCISLKEFAENRGSENSLVFIPYQDENFEGAAEGLTRQEASQMLYTISGDGTRKRGARAVFETMKSLPGFWRIAGSILSIPPLVWAAEPLYRIFARHRHKVDGWWRDTIP
jgi:predicted DCC family thiol-disulfide oxidoreductase YuxK